MMSRPQSRWVALLLTSIIICAAWLSGPALAFAHARLVSSSPAAGALLDAPPTEIVLVTSETVSTQFSSLKLLNRAGKEQAVGPVVASGSSGTGVKVVLSETLPGGTYTVLWRVLSAADGHLTAGSFSFRVRAGSTGASLQATQTAEPVTEPIPPPTTVSPGGTTDNADPFRWVVRAFILAAAALLTGGALFTVLILEPVLSEQGEDYSGLSGSTARKFSMLSTVTAFVLVPALVLDLLMQVGSIAETGLLGALGNSAIARGLVTSTRYGEAWIAKVALAVLIMVLLLPAWRGMRNRTYFASVGGILFLMAEALSSHAAAAGESASASGEFLAGFSVPWFSDWLHLVTASAWAGGLGYMALVLFPAVRASHMQAEESRAFLSRAVPRFSRLAIFSVVTLGVTGMYNLFVHSTNPGAILGSLYGQVLAVKVVLYLILVALGALNLLRLTPRLLKATMSADTPVRGLRRNVRLEVLVTLLVLACAGGLSLLPPPSSDAVAQAAIQATPQPQPLEVTPAVPVTATEDVGGAVPGPAALSTVVNGYTFKVLMHPALEGDELALSLSAQPGSVPLTDVGKVLFKITPQDVDAGTSSYVAAPSGKDTWKIKEPILTLDGNYLVNMIVQRATPPDLKAAFIMTLSPDNRLSIAPTQVVEVQVDTLPSPPISGTATIMLKVVDGLGAPLKKATVTVNPLMPAHAHAEPVAQAEPVEGKPGVYTMPVNFIMGGSWLLVLSIDRPGMPTLKTDVGVDVLDPNATATPSP